MRIDLPVKAFLMSDINWIILGDFLKKNVQGFKRTGTIAFFV
jgi:hypothetical protein